MLIQLIQLIYNFVSIAQNEVLLIRPLVSVALTLIVLCLVTL